MIDSLNEWAANWAPVLWRATWQGGVFILVVWALGKAFPRIPAKSRHWLWWLASAQLLIRLMVATPIALPLLPASRTMSPSVTFAEMYVSPEPLASAVESTRRHGADGYTSREARPMPRPSGSLMVMAVWLLGLTVCLGNLVRRLVKTRSYLRGKSLFDHNDLTDLVEELSGSLGVKAPTVRESRKAPCPLLVGWLRPTIVLPAGAIDSFSASELRMAVAHELIHLKRRDLWLSLAPEAAQVLFFFHPLAWLAAQETAAAREEACDSDALRLSGGSLAAYARLLLNSAQSSSSAAVMGAAIGYRLIQRRIHMLKSSTPGYGPITRRILTGIIALAAVCALPWTVTAQSTAAAAPAHANKVIQKLSKRSVKHSAGKNSVKHTLSKKTSRKVPQTAMTAKASFTQVGMSPTVLYWKAPKPMPSTIQTGSTTVATTPVRTSAAAVSYGSTSPATVRYGSTTTAAAAPSPAKTSNFVPSVATSSEPEVSSDNGRVSVQFDKVSLREAVKVLCKEAKIDYTIRSDVAEDTVTVSIHNADPMDVINAILKSVKQSLTWRREAGVVQIIPREGN